jgi:DNA (cytosine-5)-methyltransferase 1
MKKTVCELFAGVGGFHRGLTQADSNFKIIWANQWEPGKKVQHAFDCYKSHFGETTECVNEDIGIAKHSIPSHSLLVGGFPCQDYSVASTSAKGIEGKKGVLWWEIRDILEAKRPPFVLLENVDRLVKSPSTQRGRDFGVMLHTLNALGYSVEWRIINAADYGFAQRRRRIFIYAYHNSTMYYNKMTKKIAQDIIATEGVFAKAFPIEVEFASTQSAFTTDNLVEISNNFKYTFEVAGFMQNGVITTAKTTPIYQTAKTLAEIMEHNIDAHYFLGVDRTKWEYLKGSKQLQRTSKTGYEYTFAEGSIAFPDPTDRPARTMLTSESSVNRSTHVVEDLNTHEYRLLTPIECERLNGFADDWTNTGMPEKMRYFCMGNALVVGIIEKLGKEISKIIDKE